MPPPPKPHPTPSPLRSPPPAFSGPLPPPYTPRDLPPRCISAVTQDTLRAQSLTHTHTHTHTHTYSLTHTHEEEPAHDQLVEVTPDPPVHCLLPPPPPTLRLMV
ncbi:hypothetical protein CRUP_000928 [Coryphaenoides rupestris]|nr:hypothetical protein CRUP_000928 [Coryphaenoides rupestris]